MSELATSRECSERDRFMPACLSGTRAPAALVGPAARSAVCGVCAQDKRDRFQLIDLVGSTRRLH